MSTRWFRLYASVLNDPKVQRLEPALFKTWINMLCAASENDGIIPSIADLAFLLRRPEASIAKDIEALTVAGLIDDDETVLRPHNWTGRQFQSDVSAGRVKRHRERQRNVTPTVTAPVTVSPPDTEQIQNRAEQTRARQNEPIERKKEIDQIEAECREAAGLTDDPSPSLLDLSPIVTLIDKGYELARDILPKLREAKARGKRGGSWKYYLKAIEESKQSNGAIKPNERDKPGVAVAWICTDDPRWARLADRWQGERGKPPPHTSGQNGMGWHFPAEWLVALTEQAA
jgi:hypothetical protein